MQSDFIPSSVLSVGLTGPALLPGLFGQGWGVLPSFSKLKGGRGGESTGACVIQFYLQRRGLKSPCFSPRRPGRGGGEYVTGSGGGAEVGGAWGLCAFWLEVEG